MCCLSLVLLIFVSLLLIQVLVGLQEDQCVCNVVCVFNEIQDIFEQGIFDKLLDEGCVVVVIFDMIKVGLVIGGCCGYGLMLVKMFDGSWFNLVFVKFIGGSIGFQVGVQFLDVVLVFCNDCSLDNFVNGKFILGVDVGVVVGLVGCNVVVVIDGQLKVEIWFWLCVCGLFVGVVLDGVVLQIDDVVNLDVYGSNIILCMVFEGCVGELLLIDVVVFCDCLEEVIYLVCEKCGMVGVVFVLVLCFVVLVVVEWVVFVFVVGVIMVLLQVVLV